MKIIDYRSSVRLISTEARKLTFRERLRDFLSDLPWPYIIFMTAQGAMVGGLIGAMR